VARDARDARVWKGDQPAKLADLAVGDVSLADFTAEQTGAPAHCTDIWIGEETHKAVSEQQAKKLAPVKAANARAQKVSLRTSCI
jgi:hypothetical protein